MLESSWKQVCLQGLVLWFYFPLGPYQQLACHMVAQILICWWIATLCLVVTMTIYISYGCIQKWHLLSMVTNSCDFVSFQWQLFWQMWDDASLSLWSSMIWICTCLSSFHKCLLTGKDTVLLSCFSSTCLLVVNSLLHMVYISFLPMYRLLSHFIIYSAVWKTYFSPFPFLSSSSSLLPHFPLPHCLFLSVFWDFGVVDSTGIVDVAELPFVFSSRNLYRFIA